MVTLTGTATEAMLDRKNMRDTQMAYTYENGHMIGDFGSILKITRTERANDGSLIAVCSLFRIKVPAKNVAEILDLPIEHRDSRQEHSRPDRYMDYHLSLDVTD